MTCESILISMNRRNALAEEPLPTPMKNNPDPVGLERSTNPMMIDVALAYLEAGYRPIPLIGGTKRSRVKWAEYRARPPTEKEVRSWFRAGQRNIALVTGIGVVVVDVDDLTWVNTV